MLLIHRLPDRSRNGDYMFPRDIGNQLFVSVNPRPFAVSRLANRFSSLGVLGINFEWALAQLGDYCVHRFVRNSLFAKCLHYLTCVPKQASLRHLLWRVAQRDWCVCAAVDSHDARFVSNHKSISAHLAPWRMRVYSASLFLPSVAPTRPLTIVLYLYFH